MRLSRRRGGGDPAPERPPDEAARPSRRGVRLLLVLAVVLAIALGGFLYHPADVILRAGPAVNTLGSGPHGPLVEITGAKTYPTTGALDFTTVAQYGGPGVDVDLWDVLAARLDPEAEIVPREQLYPSSATKDEVASQTSAQMSGSQHVAEVVALRALGRPEQAVVAAVDPKAPAHALLREGDVVVSVDGTRPATMPDVARLVQASSGPVTMVVRRGGRELTVDVPTVVRDGRRVVGIAVDARTDPGVHITIDAGDVGGPSAGMMFGLAVYDKLTPGALTGGQKIAGTGTLAVDGTVGPIGGIRHKLVGAQEAGAAWFLAPRANCGEVSGHAPAGLHVAAVASFDEARTAVERIAAGRGDSLAGCPG